MARLARPAYPSSGEPLPAPLPPETRTVGQLVGETVKLYSQRFWPALALGVLPAALTIGVAQLSRPLTFALVPTVGALVLSASYCGAVCLVSDVRPPAGRLLRGVTVGALVFLPVPFLVIVFILPGIAWLALTGLAVPAALVERRGFGAALARGVRLGRVDFVHAFGSLFALALVVFLSQSVLILLLHNTGDAALWVAAFLAEVVLSPVLFLGTALLYVDQAARDALTR
jgi:hypothetical protein